MVKVVLEFVLNLLNFLNNNGNGHCIVVAPRSIRSFSEYSMSVATANMRSPMKFRIKIYESVTNPALDYEPHEKSIIPDPHDLIAVFGPKENLGGGAILDSHTTDNSTIITRVTTKTIEVAPNVPEMVKFQFDRDVPPGSYILEVQSLSDDANPFYDLRFLAVESKTMSIFIQTSNAIFRPGETIHYRVLILDANSKPINDSSALSISVYDSAKNLIQTLTEQRTKHGVFIGEVQTSSSDWPGIWEIEAQYKNQRTRKSIEFTDYEKTNFQVVVKAPHTVALEKSRFCVLVYARYTFGKSVLGMVTVTATPILRMENAWAETGLPVRITGKIHGKFIAKFSPSDFNVSSSQSILIEATVQEAATSVIGRAFDKTIRIDSQQLPSKYEISVDYFNFFLPETSFTIKVNVKCKSGWRTCFKNSTDIDFQVVYDSDDADLGPLKKYSLDGNGMTEIVLDIPANVSEKIKFKVKFQNSSKEAMVSSKPLHVQVVDFKKPKVNQKIQFQVGSNVILSHLSYYVVGRGNVLLSKTVALEEKRVNTFEFNSTLAMVPKFSLVVFYISKNGTIVSDHTEVELAPLTLANQLELTVSNTVLTPNQEIAITMEANEESHIAVSLVDQSLLLQRRGNVLSRTQVFNDLRLYDNAGDVDINAAHEEAFVNLMNPGTFVLTDASQFSDGMNASSYNTAKRRNIILDYTPDLISNIIIRLMPSGEHVYPASCSTQLRITNNPMSKQSETLIWDDFDTRYKTVILETRMPDTITSWLLTGFSLNPTSGLGVVENSIVLTTFKPFFVDVKLPHRAKLGETIAVTVAIHNYLDQNVRVHVVLDNSSEVFEQVSVGPQIADYKSVEDDDFQNFVEIPANTVSPVSFFIRPTRLGPIQIQVHAVSDIACDSVETYLTVEPEGVTITRTVAKSHLLANSSVASTIQIDTPPNVVADSVKIQLIVHGDKYSLDLLNVPLDMNAPIGLDENYFADVRLHLAMGPPTYKTMLALEIAQTALDQLTRTQCPDGGFRADNDCDQSARDTKYTVSNLMAIYKSASYLTIDTTALLRGFEFLAGIQAADGSFPNLDSDPVTSPYTHGPKLTSYVLYCFLDGSRYLPELQERYNITIKRAIEDLFDQLGFLDLLSLSMLSVSAELANFPKQLDILSYLKIDSLNDNPVVEHAYPFILQAVMLANDTVSAMRVAHCMTKYLVEQNGKVAASSMASMKIVLADFYQQYSTTNPKIEISYATNRTSIDRTNRSVLQKFDITPDSRTLQVNAAGAGFVHLEVTYQYNLKPTDILDAFKIEIDVVPVLFKEWQLKVCATFQVANTTPPVSSVMEIAFPTGFQIKRDPNTSNELKDGKLSVHMSFEHFNNTPNCFTVSLLRTIRYVTSSLTGHVVMYDAAWTSVKPYWSLKQYELPDYDSVLTL